MGVIPETTTPGFYPHPGGGFYYCQESAPARVPVNPLNIGLLGPFRTRVDLQGPFSVIHDRTVSPAGAVDDSQLRNASSEVSCGHLKLMRMIGHLKTRSNATSFSDFLLRRGIANEVEPEEEGWAVWVHSEDEFLEARGMFRRFIGNPDAPDFKSARRAERGSKEVDLESATLLAKGVSELQPGHLSGFLGFGPLTLALAFGCFALGLVSLWGANIEMLGPLFITPVESVGSLIQWQPGLPEVFSGEVWRLWSPVLIHFGFMHVLFNMLWFVALGSLVEVRQSTARLVALILLIGGASNLAQFWVHGPYFGGMSGVVYGLLGYVWMKCRYQPQSGFYISIHSVTLMMIWYFLCLLGLIPQAANTAHTVGLLMGFSIGFLSTRLSRVL